MSYVPLSTQSSESTKATYLPVAIDNPQFLALDNPPFSLCITFIFTHIFH